MIYINRDNKSSERDFERREFGKRGSDRPMHKTICSKCGNECEVPFKPSGDRPVYCSNCFENNSGSDSRRSEGRNFQRSNFRDRPMFEAVCDKCGSKCSLPFQPRSGKPVYCSKCFEGKSDRGGRSTEQYNEQFEALNAKLDKILKILNPGAVTKVALEEKPLSPKKPAKAKKTSIKIK